MAVELGRVVSDIAAALVQIDTSGVPFKAFKAGVGPYGEPQVVRLIASFLNQSDAYRDRVVTRRTPDLLIKNSWALEFKIARPFGDNGREAENWSVNLLHPYPGNVSVVGDCLKLVQFDGPERRAVVVIGYEHTPPQISLTPLFNAFELIARRITGIRLGPKIEEHREKLIHPVHQRLVVAAWEVLGKP